MITKNKFKELEDIELDDVNTMDAPDFSDAFICSATLNGKELTEDELDIVNDDRDFVYEQVIKKIY